ncbi:MAG: hypothetical protein IKR14_05175, partial [Lachnospiraceae bacterium]|nr:hypothetical protein [Lachnospiraceae bacterium]
AMLIGLLPGTKEVTLAYSYDALVNFDEACGVTQSYDSDVNRIQRLRAAFGMKPHKQQGRTECTAETLDVCVDGYTTRGTEDLIMGYALAKEPVGITVKDATDTTLSVSIRRVVRADANRKYRNVAADDKTGYIVSYERDEDIRFPLTVQFQTTMIRKQVKISKGDAKRGMRPGKGARIANHFHKGIQLLGEEGLGAFLARLGDKRAKKSWEKQYRRLER